MPTRKIITDDAFADKVVATKQVFASGLARQARAFWNSIGRTWFTMVFPEKHRLYGSRGLQRLGPKHCISDFIGCYSRWERMSEAGLTLDHESMRDAISDAFGYAVLMCVTSDLVPAWDRAVADSAPSHDSDLLLSLYWECDNPVDVPAVTMAIRCAMRMWVTTWDKT
jgi:hypothetical protein